MVIRIVPVKRLNATGVTFCLSHDADVRPVSDRKGFSQPLQHAAASGKRLRLSIQIESQPVNPGGQWQVNPFT